jgi:high-affinity nickel permease
MFSLWEAATRKPASPRVVNTLVNVFAVLLIGVLILLSFRDVDRWFGKSHREEQEPQTEEAQESVAPEAVPATNNTVVAP